MTAHAYEEDYLWGAQRILGDMFDFGVNTCNLDIDFIMDKFVESGVADNFAIGNPKYVAGMTGCEVLRTVLEKTGEKDPIERDIMYVDKSPEYWAGWAIAFYQWYKNYKFQDIKSIVPMSEIVKMYVLHEADVMKFVETMDKKQEKISDKIKDRLSCVSG